jgi:hypothetical protein
MATHILISPFVHRPYPALTDAPRGSDRTTETVIPSSAKPKNAKARKARSTRKTQQEHLHSPFHSIPYQPPTMADTTSNPQSGVDWEDACLDPHHGSLEEGKAQGREAGALAGFREGQVLGENKGLEFGLEVGFYQGIVTALIESSTENEFSERVQKSIQKLQESIDAFPPPDEVFSNTRKSESSVMAMKASTSSSTKDLGEEGDPEENDSEDPSKFDILNKLQRIRARFKLLTVQLGKPQFSLRNALEDHLTMAKSHGDGGEQGW